MVIHPCAKYAMPISKTKEVMACEVKGHGHIEVMNVCDKSSHGDITICQIWYAYVKEYRRQTVIPISPLKNFVGV